MCDKLWLEYSKRVGVTIRGQRLVFYIFSSDVTSDVLSEQHVLSRPGRTPLVKLHLIIHELYY